jgi:hypothetical protein
MRGAAHPSIICVNPQELLAFLAVIAGDNSGINSEITAGDQRDNSGRNSEISATKMQQTAASNARKRWAYAVEAGLLSMSGY